MESAHLDMDEIFDDRDEDEDLGAVGVLPDLPDDSQLASQSQDNDDEGLYGKDVYYLTLKKFNSEHC